MILDKTCYVGCTTPTTGITQTTVPVKTTLVTTPPPVVPHGGLALTGADLGEMIVIGIVCLFVGIALWRAARRGRHA